MEFCWRLVRLQLGASLRRSIGSVLRLHSGLNGCRAAAPPLLWLCIFGFSVLCSKWSVPDGVVADLAQGQHCSGGGRGWNFFFARKE
jgi:hypothetical protein